MRGLKITAIACLALLLVVVLMVSYLFMTAEVTVEKISAQGIPAGNDPDGFAKLTASVDEGTFEGTLFQKPMEWKDAPEYVFLNYTLRIRNNCLVPIDMIEVQIVPQSTDILEIGDLSVHSLEAKSEGDLSVQILAPKDTQPVREMVVTYYVWGVSFTLKTTYGM